MISAHTHAQTKVSKPKPVPTEQQQSYKKVEIAVKEMSCQKGCADGIDKKLKTVDGIIRSRTKFETGICIVTFDDKKISAQEIVKIIEKHGCPASVLK